MTAPQVGLSVPLYNEAAVAETAVRNMVDALEGAGISHVLALVDNGSQDETRDIIARLAEEMGPSILPVHLEENAGYGGGIQAGMAALQAGPRPELVGWAWGDDQVDPAVLPVLVDACTQGATLAKARRTTRKDGLFRRVVTQVYAVVMRMLGVRCPDVNGCPKILALAAWESHPPSATDWFLDAELVIRAEALGWTIHHAPVAMRPRQAGRSKVGLPTITEFLWNLCKWKLGHGPTPPG